MKSRITHVPKQISQHRQNPYLEQRPSNIIKHSSPNRPNIVFTHHQSPSAKIMPQGFNKFKPSAQYLRHLVPQVNVQATHQPQNIQVNIINRRPINPMVQFFENKPVQAQNLTHNNNQIPCQQSEINRSKPSYSITSDKRSCRSLSQHNIHITIESSVDAQPPPSIIISPSQKRQVHIINPVLPPLIPNNAYPISRLPKARPVSLSHNNFNHNNFVIPVRNPPITIINNPPQQAYPKQVHQNTIASYSSSQQSLNPNTHTFNNELIKREKMSSLSTGELIYNHRSSGKKQSIARHEYYNQNEVSQKDDNQSNSTQNRKNGIIQYIREEKFNINSRRLIDEIFQNETNKALLQMCEVESKSRTKLTSKKSQSKSTHKKQI